MRYTFHLTGGQSVTLDLGDLDAQEALEKADLWLTDVSGTASVHTTWVTGWERAPEVNYPKAITDGEGDRWELEDAFAGTYRYITKESDRTGTIYSYSDVKGGLGIKREEW